MESLGWCKRRGRKSWTNNDDTVVSGITQVTLTAEWSRGGVKQNKQLVFYVYRAG